MKLKFAEIWFGSPGQRVFNIALNSQTVQTGFDIVAAAGGAFRAVDLSFPVTVSAGQIVIRLTPVVENPKISAIEIVPASGSPIAVSVSPASASLGPSQSQQFTATVTGTANTAVTWSLNPAVGTVSAAGLYTAPATVTVQQTVTVTATSVADPTKTASGAVTLTPVVAVAVAVSPAAATLSASQPQQFTATVTGTANTAVTWSLSPAVGTVSAAGLYTAPATVAIQQTVSVTATSVADPTKVGEWSCDADAAAGGLHADPGQRGRRGIHRPGRESVGRRHGLQRGLDLRDAGRHRQHHHPGTVPERAL